MAAFLYEWMDERLGLTEAIAFARHKTVPVHAQSFWYYWGGISTFFFLVQVLTGILLLVYYRPGAEAFESVRQITYVMHFGWLIRSAHAWAANLFIFSIIVHMFSVYFMKAYRRPREVGWFSGIALLFLAAMFGFSGYLLPMDELSYFATKVGLAIPESPMSRCTQIPEFCRSTPFLALKARNSESGMYANPGQTLLQAKGDRCRFALQSRTAIDSKGPKFRDLSAA